MTATIELRDVCKGFPGAQALVDVSLTAEPGRIHALVGENGAGKSTLIKIASGVLQPDSGAVWVQGQEASLSPGSARAHGIRVVHQERQVALSRTVAENLMLDGAVRNRFGCVTRASIAKAAKRRLDRIGLQLDLDAPTRTLTVAQTQMLEIARAVSFDASCIIMDEPTASLHRSEVGQLFDVLRRIRENGIAVIYISHHLDEIMTIADDYTVLRDGHLVANGVVADVTSAQMVSMMFGREVSLRREDVIGMQEAPGEVAVELNNVSVHEVVTDVSLKVRRGEVVVVTGAVGSGATQIGQLVAGSIAPTAGEVHLMSAPAGARAKAAKAGVAFLPADRKKQALMLERSVTENLLLAEFAVSRSRMYAPVSAAKRAAQACSDLSVKVADVRNPVKSLSGGNQQRIVLARWLNVKSTVLVLDDPTVGVDIPSKLAIYKIIRDRARAGAAVLVLSTEYQEIHCVADRVIVMRDGRVIGELSGEEATEDRIFELELGS